jgi:hypothetical protein
MRADMDAIGQSVTPDTWVALEEVRDMAGKQRTRRNVVMGFAAAVVVLAGIAVVPAVGQWWQTSDAAPASRDAEQEQSADPMVEDLVDEMIAAINAADTQAVLDLLTEDASFYGTPIADTGQTGLARQIQRYSGYGFARDDAPALAADDGFDYAIVFRGTLRDTEVVLDLIRARLVDDELKIYEVDQLKAP